MLTYDYPTVALVLGRCESSNGQDMCIQKSFSADCAQEQVEVTDNAPFVVTWWSGINRTKAGVVTVLISLACLHVRPRGVTHRTCRQADACLHLRPTGG